MFNGCNTSQISRCWFHSYRWQFQVPQMRENMVFVFLALTYFTKQMLSSYIHFVENTPGLLYFHDLFVFNSMCVCVYHTLYCHKMVDILFDFHTLVILSWVVTNMWAQIPFSLLFSFHLDILPRDGLTVLYARSIFIFLRNLLTVLYNGFL